MIAYAGLIASVAIGAALGLFFFGGLWWTLKRLPVSRKPQFVMAASFLVRSALTVAGFWAVMDGRWERLLAALAGFLVMRMVVMRRLPPAAQSVEPVQEE